MPEQYRITKHAQKRMLERNITWEEVFAVLNEPKLQFPGKGDAVNVWGEVNGRGIRVTVTLISSTYGLVLTVVDQARKLRSQ